MKRLFLVSCYVLLCATMSSCSEDEIEPAPKNTIKISADLPDNSGGGSSGQTPTTPPKP